MNFTFLLSSCSYLVPCFIKPGASKFCTIFCHFWPLASIMV